MKYVEKKYTEEDHLKLVCAYNEARRAIMARKVAASWNTVLNIIAEDYDVEDAGLCQPLAELRAMAAGDVLNTVAGILKEPDVAKVVADSGASADVKCVLDYLTLARICV